MTFDNVLLSTRPLELVGNEEVSLQKGEEFTDLIIDIASPLEQKPWSVSGDGSETEAASNWSVRSVD